MIGTAVQKAVFDALKASPAVAGGNVFDAVPASDPFPRVTIGDEQVIDDGNTCDAGWEVVTDIHVWSRAVGFPEAKGIASAVRQRITAIATVTGFTLISVAVENAQSSKSTDGLTSHITLTARFVLTPA
jgi:hypothetical protein